MDEVGERELPLVVFALAPAAAAVMAWGDGLVWPRMGPPDGGDPWPRPTADESRALLSAMRISVEPALLSRLGDAVQANEPAALDVVATIADVARAMMPQLLESLSQSFREQLFAAARQIGPVTAELAFGCELSEDAATAYLISARSAFALDDLDSTIQLYTNAVGCSGAPDATLCACHGNLALAYVRRGAIDDLDQALRHFQTAMDLAPTTMDQLAVRRNRLRLLSALGQFTAAAAEAGVIYADVLLVGAPERDQAVALDVWAGTLHDTGDLDGALVALEAAAGLFPQDAVDDRSINALQRSQVLLEADRRREAGLAFVAADALARQAADDRLDVAHLRAGYAAALRTRVATAHPAWRSFLAGIDAMRANDWPSAWRALGSAARLANEAGDVLLELRCRANHAAALADADQVREAVRLCTAVRDAALQRGLAGVAAMAVGTLMSLAQSGADTSAGPALLLGHRCRALERLHARLVAEANLPLDDPERQLLVDDGTIEVQLGALADDHGAPDLAVRYIRAGLAAVQGNPNEFAELNRSVRLLHSLGTLAADGDDSARREADALAADLEARLARGDVLARAEVALRRGLAGHYGARDPRRLAHLIAAAAAVDTLRRGLPPGERRAQLDRGGRVTPQLVDAMHAAGRPAAEIFDALQVTRARGLLEEATAREGGEYRPPTAAQVQSTLAGLGPGQALLDITLVTGGVLVLLVDTGEVRSFFVRGEFHALDRAMQGDARHRDAAVVAAMLAAEPMIALAAEVENALAPGARLLVVVDDTLANLPWHLVPVGDRSWGDVRIMGRIAAAGVLALTPATRGWTGRSLVAGDSRGDLPGADHECADVAAGLATTALVGEDCRLPQIAERLVEQLDVVHVAVHGRADSRRGGRSSLLLRSAAGDPVWVPFDQLADLPWRAQLIVFSGCSTAVGGPRDSLGLYGVAQAAAQAGATTVVASLWPVADDAARYLMTEFHANLCRRRERGDRLADLREVLQEARRDVVVGRARPDEHPLPRRPTRDGRDVGLEVDLDEPTEPVNDSEQVQHHLRWGAFVVLGEPTIALASSA